MDVSTDYDQSTDFRAYKTYDWLSTTPGQSDSRVDRWVKAAVSKQLVAKGLERSSSVPDLLLTYYVGLEDKIVVSNRGYQYIPRQRSRYASRRRDMATVTYQEGTLILDFVDAGSKELVYRSTVLAVLDTNATSAEDERLVNEAVAKMLDSYPP